MAVIRVPTDEEYNDFLGCELWYEVAETWTCPACGRSRRETMRWRDRWISTIVLHHDHGSHARNRRERFPTTIICEQCNAADGNAKTALRLPSRFSFSASEIREFVTATPHGWHRIDTAKAEYVFLSLLDLMPWLTDT